MENQNTKNTELTVLDNLPTKLKEIAKKGEDGQFITLVDIEQTKTILSELSKKYKGLEVTKDNYKNDALKAEKELRQTRYALQRIHKSNNAFLNEVKRGEKETYEGLISLIQPEEKRIYTDISVFKEKAKREKEEVERKEKERIDRIEKTLKEAEFSLEKALIQGKTDDDIKKYDEFLDELKSQFADFEEMEFKAKRLHAIYTAKRGGLEKQVREWQEMEEKRKEEAEKAKIRAEKALKIFKARESYLIKKGLKQDNGNLTGHGLTYKEEEIKEKDEVEWYDIQEEVEKTILEYKKRKQEEEKEKKAEKEKREIEALKDALKHWSDLLTIYKGLGGDVKLWKLKKNEIPSKKDVEELTKATKELHKKQKRIKLERVKKEIKPFKDEILNFIDEMEHKIDEAKFNHSETRSILKNFTTSTKKIFNNVFNEEQQ